MDRRAGRDEREVELYGSMIEVPTQKPDVDVRITEVISILATSHPPNPVDVRGDGVDNTSSRDHW